MTDLYRPKINKKNYNTIGRYSKFMNQSNDPNDWGYRKHHIYNWEAMNDNMVEFNTNKNTKHQLKGAINYHYTYSKDKPFGTGKNRRIINTFEDIEEINKFSSKYLDYVNQWNSTGKITMYKKRRLCMERHLLAAQYGDKHSYLFYTTSPKKELNIICLDVDKILSDEDYYAVITYLSSLFPNCYYERSTNGTGLHFYIITKFNFNRYFFSDVNEGVFRNTLYYLLSQSLGAIVNDNFNVKFDAVKGTNPLYDINNGFLKYGNLVKLPAPVTYEQFHTLYSSFVYSEYYLLRIINYLNDVACNYSHGVYTTDYLTHSLSLALTEIAIRSSSKDFVSFINKYEKPYSLITPSPSPSITTITNGGTKNLSPDKKARNKAKKEDYKKYTIGDIMNIGDSRSRESLYIKRYVGDYYSKYGELPPEEIVEEHYRTEMNYNKIGAFRKKRFSKYYQHTIDTFDPDKALNISTPYQIGIYNDAFTDTHEKLTEWVNKNKAFKRNIYRYDVDITLEYIYLCSLNKINRAREILIERYAKEKKMTEEQVKEALVNTVPRKGLIGFYKFIAEKQKNIIINGKMKKINTCDPKKATALLDLVVKLGLADCIDSTFCVFRARKFRLSETVHQIRENWNNEQGGNTTETNSQSGSVMVA